MMDDFKMAYLIISYMDPKQLGRLVGRLVCTADVYVHINANVEIAPFNKCLEELHGKGRVVLSKKRYRVVWGGYSILKATFAVLEEALNWGKYDRIVLLTGLDYPIKSDIAICDFFKEHPHTQYIHASLEKGAFDHYICRDYRRMNKILNKLESLGLMNQRRGLDRFTYKNKEYLIYGVAPKWALTYEVASYLLHFWITNRKFNRHFWFIHAPDDFYVATVLFNSKFKKYIEAENDIFKIIWTQTKGAKILTEGDFTELVECGQLYAKKFQSNYYSIKLLQMLEGEFKKEYRREEVEK